MQIGLTRGNTIPPFHLLFIQGCFKAIPQETTFFANNELNCPSIAGSCLGQSPTCIKPKDCDMNRHPFSFGDVPEKEDQLDLPLLSFKVNAKTLA